MLYIRCGNGNPDNYDADFVNTLYDLMDSESNQEEKFETEFYEVKDMSQCMDFSCPNRTLLGYCQLTACSKQFRNQTITLNNNVIIFPQTIGNITFYNKKDLFDWVENQQKMNKDPDYGRGNWA